MKTYIIPENLRTRKFYRLQSKKTLDEWLCSSVCSIPHKEVLREITKRKYVEKQRKKYYKRLNLNLIYNPLYP